MAEFLHLLWLIKNPGSGRPDEPRAVIMSLQTLSYGDQGEGWRGLLGSGVIDITQHMIVPCRIEELQPWPSLVM